MAELPKTPPWEPVAIILAIVALFPKILAFLQKRHWLLADVLMYAALAAMVIVFVCKARRFKKLWDQAKGD